MIENDYTGDEVMGMTDYQFQCYKDERDEKERTLRQEVQQLKEKLASGNHETPHGADAMTDMQTKILLASIADILTSSHDLAEANERFKRITNAAGVFTDNTPLASEATQQDKQRLPALDADIKIEGNVVTVTADDGIVISLSTEEWESLRNEFGLDRTVDFERGETPASGYEFRSFVDLFRKHKNLLAERGTL